MPNDWNVQIGAGTWGNWTQLQIEGDYLVPSDSWSVTARTPDALTWMQLTPGLPVLIRIGVVIVLRGLLESVSSQRSKQGGLEVTLAGRDLAGPLADCGPGPSWAFPATTLVAAAQAAMAALVIPGTVVGAGEAMVPLAIRPEVGESYWELLGRLAKKSRMGLWMSPLGVLSIGRPDYLAVPVATIINSNLVPDSTNCLEVRFSHDITGQRSPVTVVGQAGESDGLSPSYGPTAVFADPTLSALGLVRPLTIDDGEIGSITQALARARYEVERRAFEARRLEVVVSGALATPKAAWTPGQMVALQDDIHGLTGLWWVRSRRITMDRQAGTRTTLSLHPPNLYLPAV